MIFFTSSNNVFQLLYFFVLQQMLFHVFQFLFIHSFYPDLTFT